MAVDGIRWRASTFDANRQSGQPANDTATDGARNWRARIDRSAANTSDGIVTFTPWLRHGRCFIVSECARYLTVVIAFRRSSSSMPSGCIAVSR